MSCFFTTVGTSTATAVRCRFYWTSDQSGEGTHPDLPTRLDQPPVDCCYKCAPPGQITTHLYSTQEPASCVVISMLRFARYNLRPPPTGSSPTLTGDVESRPRHQTKSIQEGSQYINWYRPRAVSLGRCREGNHESGRKQRLHITSRPKRANFSWHILAPRSSYVRQTEKDTGDGLKLRSHHRASRAVQLPPLDRPAIGMSSAVHVVKLHEND